MKAENNESLSLDNSDIISECDMSEQEFCNWLALCNALKFINSTSELTGKIIDEKDIDYREMINYISTVSGDISTCLKEKQGVPFKYSLDTRLKESLEIEDLNYEFLDN
jgi:ethanolamine utilization protein EutA (predicted chaperonin)